jgi:hypothetical protein
VLEHDGRWYLFYTTWSPSPICYQVAGSPLAPPAEWGPQIPLTAIDSGVPTVGWFGSETFQHDGRDYFAAVNSDAFVIEFREMVWEDSIFSFAEPMIVPDTTDSLPPPTGVEDDARSWRLSTSGPPSWSRLSIVIEAPRAADVRLDVVDVAGRRERRLLAGRVPAGTTTLVWDGRDDAGRSLSPGVHFLVLGTPDRLLSRRVVRTR